MTTQNTPRPQMTRVCTEATTDDEHVGCSGGFCQCECHPAPAPTPLHGARPGRFGTAPPHVVAELAKLREARKAARRQR